MKKLKSYSLFLEDKTLEYSIYDWFEDLKRFQWAQNQKTLVNESTLEKWTEHFVGKGYWKEVSDLVNRIINALQKVDIEDIEDRMLDVYDFIPSEKQRWSMCSVVYGDWKNFDKSNKDKFNGTLSAKEPKDSRLNIIIAILKDIIYPTLSIGSYPSRPLRQTDEQVFVTDTKWNCHNFNIDNYDYKEGQEFQTDDWKGRKIKISSWTLDEKRGYSPDKVLSMYKPAITINIGGFSDSNHTSKMSLTELEEKIDEVLPTILPTLDYEEVIFDLNRGDRKFDVDSYYVYDYTIKILLNF